MKKIYILFIVFFLTITLQAQENPSEEKVNFTIKSGWLHSTLKGKDVDFLASNGKIKTYNSFFAGIGINNPIGKTFSLKHEIFYQNYGGKFNRVVSNQEIDADLTMHGLRINPISPTVRFKDLHVFAGPYINILLNSSITAVDEQGNIYKDHDIFGSEIDDQEDSHFLQNMDFGLVVGAEYYFKFDLFIGIQYSRGFAGIFDNSNVYENFGPEGPKDLKIYNQTLGVYAGYKF